MPVFMDDRSVYIGNSFYKQGLTVRAEHVEQLRHAGYTIDEPVQEPDETPAPVPRPASELSYKELKARALEAGYDGKDGFNAEALSAFLGGK